MDSAVLARNRSTERLTIEGVLDTSNLPISGERFMAASYPPPSWFISGLLPEGLTLLFAPPKSGKTYLGLSLAVSLATGTSALNHFATMPSGVFYHALEDSESVTQPRIAAMLRTRGLEPRHFEGRMWIQTVMPALDKGGYRQIEEEAAGPGDVIFVDTVGAVQPRVVGRTNLYLEDRAILKPLHDVAKAYHVAIVLIGHTRKPTGLVSGENFVAEVRGTYGFAGGADTIMVLERPNNSPTAKLHVTSRVFPGGSFTLEFVDDDWVCLGDGRLADLGGMQKRIVDVILRHGPLSLQELYRKLRGASENTIRSAAYRARDKGVLLQHRDGTYGLAQALRTSSA